MRQPALTTDCSRPPPTAAQDWLRLTEPALRRSHCVRGFDRAPYDAKGDGVYDRSASEEKYHAKPNDFIQAELTDKEAIAKAMEGIVRWLARPQRPPPLPAALSALPAALCAADTQRWLDE